MRLANWTLAVGAALFISGIAFIIAGAREAPAAAPAAPVVEVTPVADIRQIMNVITQPTVNVIYNAVGTVYSANGIVETEPRNDEEWANVAANAAALAESGNLLLTGNRLVDNGDWVTMTRDMIAAAQGAVTAAETKSKDGIFEAGGAINQTCDNCHAKYQRQ